MNLEARKIEFIQEFLKLQSEDIISRLENILDTQKNTSSDSITEADLNKRIDQSEADFRKNKFKISEELLLKYK